MTLWGIFKSPLMMGGNMPENDEWTLSLLTNREYLEMHSNSFGAHQHSREEKNNQGTVAWISNGSACKYLAVFNTCDKEKSVSFNLSEILMPNTKYSLLEVWSGEVQTAKNKFKMSIEPHGARLYKITQ